MCTHTPTWSVLPSQPSLLLADLQGKDQLGVPVTQPMCTCVIFNCTDGLKGSTANQVVRMWPAHCEQFGSFQTTMSEANREVLHITDVKVIQHKINNSSREKVLPAIAEDKVYKARQPSTMV